MKECFLCKEAGKVHYRVKSINYKRWVFCCIKCWGIVSKEENYLYGGTRNHAKKLHS